MNDDWLMENTGINISIPEGLEELLEEIIRAVLKAHPTSTTNLETFIKNHLEELLYIREKASARSTQGSPEEDQEKKFPLYNSLESAHPVAKGKTAPIVSGETSPTEDDDEILTAEPTAVSTLAASTGTVAILGTTATATGNEESSGKTKRSSKNSQNRKNEKPSAETCISSIKVVEEIPDPERTVELEEIELTDKDGISKTSTSKTKTEQQYRGISTEQNLVKNATSGETTMEKTKTVVIAKHTQQETVINREIRLGKGKDQVEVVKEVSKSEPKTEKVEIVKSISMKPGIETQIQINVDEKLNKDKMEDLKKVLKSEPKLEKVEIRKSGPPGIEIQIPIILDEKLKQPDPVVRQTPITIVSKEQQQLEKIPPPVIVSEEKKTPEPVVKSKQPFKMMKMDREKIQAAIIAEAKKQSLADQSAVTEKDKFPENPPIVPKPDIQSAEKIIPIKVEEEKIVVPIKIPAPAEEVVERGLSVESQKIEDTSDSERDSTSNDVISVISGVRGDLPPDNGERQSDKLDKYSRSPSSEAEGSKTPGGGTVVGTGVVKNIEAIRKFENISFEEKFHSKDPVDSPSLVDEFGKEISSTSLNTLGEDDSEISDLEADAPQKKTDKTMLRRFDTISSNGETSYNVSVVEEGNLSSLSEELSEQLELLELEHLAKEQFQMDENIVAAKAMELHDHHDEESLIETVKREVNKICDLAVERTTHIMQKEFYLDVKDLEDGNNASECSGVSIIDSVVAERGSDIDSSSIIFDEQSDSRPLSFASGSKYDDVDEMVNDDDFEDLSNTAIEDVKIPTRSNQEDLSDTEKTTLDSSSEDLPKPPELEDLPVHNINDGDSNLDITEDDLKSVEQPDVSTAVTKIQAGIRGYLTRKQLRSSQQMKNEDGESFEEVKDYPKGKRMSLDSKLNEIEHIKKLPKLRTTLSECVEDEAEFADKIKDLEEKAAKKIQTSFRNYKARKSICLGEQSRKSNKNSNGIIENKKSNGTILNKEQKNGLTQNSDPEGGINLENPKDVDLEEAVKKIQATYRGFKTRKSIQISASAATKIQATFRGYKVRRQLQKCSSLGDLQNSGTANSSCSNLSSSLEDKCAAKIQAGIRGYLVRKRHSLQITAASKIQTNYRKYKFRKQIGDSPVKVNTKNSTPDKMQESSSDKTCPDSVAECSANPQNENAPV